MPAIPASEFTVETGGDDDPCGPFRAYLISDTGGLTQFGARLEVLPPGSRSSIKHWHQVEDEMVYVVAGEITLIEGETETLLNPGDAATFRAGDPVGHFMENRSDSETRLLVVGTRAQADQVTYPELDRIRHRDGAKPDDEWTDLAGNPAPSPFAD